MSIRQKFITLLLSIGLAPTLLVSLAAFVITSNNLTDDTVNQLASLAKKQEEKISNLLQGKQESEVRLANSYDFQLALGRFIASGRKADHDAVLAILRDKKANATDIDSISVTGLDYATLASTRAEMENQKLDPDFQLKPGTDSNIAVKQDSKDNIGRLSISTRVSVNKADTAVLVMIFRIEDVTAAIQDYTGLGKTGETVISSVQDGKVISLFPLRFNTDAALKAVINPALHSRSDVVIDNLSDYRGSQVMAATRPIQFADWSLATKIDRAEAFAPNFQLANTLTIIVAVSSVVIVLIALAFTKFFTGPILQIARVSQLIGKGDFSMRVKMRRNDEVGALGNSINAMGNSLQAFVTDIQSQRNRLETILNSIEEGILAVDKTGTIIIVNRAAIQLTHLSSQQLVGKQMNDIFTWFKNSQTYVIDYNAPGNNSYGELQYTNSINTTHYVKLIVSRLGGEQEQRAAQTIITIRDETKSRELDNMKADFVSMAAHELRTPLASIRGFLELVSFQVKKNITEDVEKYIKQALDTITELGSLIDSLLDVSRIERGTMAFNMTKVDLAADAKQIVEASRLIATGKKIDLSYSGPAEGSFVAADRVALHEVMNNLLSNAIKYTRQEGKIEVSLSQQNGTYVVDVKDNGVGIPKQALPYVFTKFYRVTEGGLSSGSSGTGLGLFIAKSIIERHHGVIRVESEEGVGSTFIFSLPVYKPEQLQNAVPEVASLVSRPVAQADSSNMAEPKL